MQKILISACLLGESVRYDGGNCMQSSDTLKQWVLDERVVPLCPEVAGGLPVPRPPAEIELGDAEAVLRGKAEVLRKDGMNVTDAFVEGAERALALCMRHDIRMAILKQGSPSCGSALVNDGNFSGTKIAGQGVTARLLERHGVRVFGEEQLDAAAAHLTSLES